MDGYGLMRVLLLNPPSKQTVLRDYYCSSASKAGYLWHPIDLLAQSAILSPDHDVQVIDAVADKINFRDTRKLIRNYRPQAVLSLTSAGTWRDDFMFLENLKPELGFTLAVSGEIFLSDAKQILDAHPWIDAALLSFIGRDFKKFIEGAHFEPENLAWREGPEVKIVRTPARGTFKIGMPRHDLFPMKRYRMPWQMHHPFATVMTDYGCPFSCAFCNSRSFGYATREIEEIDAELNHLADRGVRQLFIKDMTFGASRPHAIRVLELMIMRGWKFKWHCYSRADLIDQELADLMRRAGCHLVQIGVESADEKLLEQYGKKINAETVKKAFRILKRNGINAGAHFILGLPGDSVEGIRRTVALAVALDPIYASFNVAMPRLGASLDATGWMDRPLDSSSATPFYELDGLSSGALIKERRRALQKFYLRPIYWLSLTREIKTMYQFWNLAAQAAGLLTKRHADR